MNALQRIARGAGVSATVDHETYTLDELPFLFDQALGGLPSFQQTLVGDRVSIAPEFLGFARGAFKGNAIVFTCVLNRMQLFQQATFKFRSLATGALFGNTDLAPLERPLPGKKTSYLLALAELFNSSAGNFFCARRAGDRLRPLRPDWTSIILGSNDPRATPENLNTIDVEVVGYQYVPGGPGSGNEPITLLPEQVAHYMPIPDPESPWRGMSWLTSVLNEVAADRETTEHKRKFLERGGTPNLAVVIPAKTVKEFEEWVAKYRSEREGPHANPYKHLFLGLGADPKVIGADLTKMDFRNVQGGGEVRICGAAGVPASIAQISDGLAGSTLNAGNFEAAWRMMADQTIRPLWDEFAGAMESVVPPPAGAELAVDVSDVAAMKEGAQTRAEVTNKQAQSIATLVRDGFTAESAVAAVTTNDLSKLEHTNLVSVQLLPPGASGNGAANGHAVLAP